MMDTPISTRRSRKAWLRPLDELAADERGSQPKHIGGKAARLVWLEQHGFKVPQTWVLPQKAFATAVRQLSPACEPRSLLRSASGRAVYARASVLLLTLVDDPMLARTVPSKLQSYLATGVPIVAAVNGEAAAIVTASGGGLSCTAGDPQALADAVRRLYRMTPEERGALGAAGRRYFERHYRPDMLAKRLLAGLSQVATRTPAHAFDGDTA